MGRRKYEALVLGAPGAAEYSAGAADAPQPHHGGTKVLGVYSCCDNGGELGFALLERSSELVQYQSPIVVSTPHLPHCSRHSQ